MKINKIILFLLFCTFGVQNIQGQDVIDANRMNRDINIMENILQELFKTNWGARGNRVHVVHSGTLSFGQRNDIRGTYLPGYGVIFTIPGGFPAFVVSSDAEEGENFSYTFRYSDDESSQKEVSEESITNRIQEFLREYGSTIGQLKDEDKIMVVYNNRQKRNFAFFDAEDESKKPQDLPTISVVAEFKDLKAYRTGNLSKEDLNQRFSLSKVDNGTKDRLDLKVMANIFETALKEQEGPGFRIAGNIDYLHLENFGALFFFDAHYSSRAGVFSLSIPRVRNFYMNEGEEQEQARVEVQRKIEETLSETKKKQEERAEDIRKSYDAFINNLREYLVDYGRTLSSVTSGQHIMISATITSSIDDIPERVDMQLEKSVLESLDRGTANREEAMSQIVVREY